MGVVFGTRRVRFTLVVTLYYINVGESLNLPILQVIGIIYPVSHRVKVEME